MVIFEHRYELMDYAESKGMPSIYDLLNKVLPSKEGLAYTDGKNIYIEPVEFNSLCIEDEFFILSHEMLHILYKHTEMSKTIYSNRKLLNICQDIVINEYLAKKLKYKCPAGLYLDSINEILNHLGSKKRIKYEGTLTTKALYEYLSMATNNSFFKTEIEKLPTDIVPCQEDDQDSSLSTELATELRSALKITKNVMKEENKELTEEYQEESDPTLLTTPLSIPNEGSQGAGTGTGSKTEVVNGNRVISTKEIVKYINKFIGDNAVVKGRSQTYIRPSRRFQSKELVLKGAKHTKTIKEITIYLDTSGSMNSEFINDMYNTLKILYKTVPFKMFTFDTSIYPVTFASNYLPKGGGTNITNVLSHIEKNKYDVSILVTDCGDNFSLDNVSTDILIFTDDKGFKTDKRNVKVTYWE